MKAFVFIIAVGFAAASNWHSAYQSESEYVYRYDSQVLSGVPHHGLQHSGVQISATVKLQLRAGSQATLQLQDVKICKIQTELSSPFVETEMLPESLCSPVEASLYEDMNQELTKPVKFTYQQGQVSTLQMDAQESLWCANFKKGILSTFKVNLGGEQRAEDEMVGDWQMKRDSLFDDEWQYSDDWELNEQWKAGRGLFNDNRFKSNQLKVDLGFSVPAQYESFFTERNTDHVHTVMESDVCGVCKTVYGVMNAERGILGDSNKLRVTKVKDFNHCALAPRHQQGLISGLTIMPQKYSEKNLVEKSSHTDYILNGNEGAFIIENVKQLSTFTLQPMTKEHGSAVTTTIQQMTLISCQSIGAAIQPPVSLSQRSLGLLYEFPQSTEGKQSLFGMEQFDMQMNMEIAYSTPQQKINQIDALLQEVIQLVHPRISIEATEKVRKIECVLKSLTYSELVQVMDSYLVTGDSWFSHGINKRRKSEILLDILPTLTSPKVVPVMIHLMTNNMISQTRAAMSFKLMALTVTPNTTTLELLKPTGRFGQYCQSSCSRYVRNTIIINTGSIVRRFVKNAVNKGYSRQQAISQVETHFMSTSQLYADVKSTQDINEKVAKLKSIGNSGFGPAIPLLAEIAKAKSQSNKVRKAAIFAFSRLPRIVKPKSEDVLLSIYMDRTEQPEIRMTAFTALIDLKPCQAKLQLIVRIQRKETSIQVGSFVYSYLSNLARAELPALYRFAFNLRKMMPLLRPIMPDTYTTAKGLHFDQVSKYNDIGIGLDFLKMNGPRDVLPSTVMSRISLHVLGKTIDSVSGGISMSGVQPILSQLLGAHSGFLGSMSQKSLKQIIQNYLTPLQSGSIEFGDVANEIKGIVSKLGIMGRPVLEKLDMGVYLKFLDNDIAFLDFTADDIITLLKTGDVPAITQRVTQWLKQLSASQDQLDILKVLNSGVSSLQFPTPAGFPVFVNMSAVAIGHVSGRASMTGSRFMDIINYGISGNLPSEIIANSQIDSSLAASVSAKFGARVGLISTGVRLTAQAKQHLPLNIKGTWSRQTGKVKIAFELPPQTTEVLKAEIVPTTFVLRESVGSCVDFRYQEQEITQPSHRQTMAIQFSVPLGVNSYYNDQMQHGNQLMVDIKAPKTYPGYLPYEHLWSRQSIKLTLQPTGTPVPTVVEFWTSCTPLSDDLEQRQSLLPEYVSVNPLITNPRVVKAGISVGSDNDRKAEVSAVLLVSKDMWVQQLNTRVSAPSYFAQPLSADLFLNLNAMTSQPGLRSRLSPSTPVAQLTVISPSGTTFDLNVKPQGQSPRSWDQSFKNLYIRGIEKLTGETVQVSQIDSIPESYQTVTYKVDIQGSNINWNKAETMGLQLAAASWAYFGVPSLSTFDARGSGAPTSHIEGYLTVCHKLRKGVLTLRTPNSMEYSMEIPTYVYKPWHKISSIQRPILYNYDTPDQSFVPAQYPWQQAVYGACAVQYSEEIGQQRVTTFDSLSYTFPALPQSCEVVLAKDCSSLNLFTVLMTPVQRTKIVKVLVPGHRILVKPVTGWVSSTINVQVNGQELSLSDSVEIPLRSQAAALQGSQISGVIVKHGSWVTVRISTLGLIVSTDGSRVVVKTGLSMRSHLCGLCGNFNDDSADEYEGPDMMVYPKSEHMISRYVLSSDSCSLSAVREQYQIPENFFQRNCQTEQRTHIIQHMGKTCFSINPIQSCSSSCRGGQLASMSVPVHCRNADNAYTIRMMEESRTLKIVPNMASKRQDEVISIDVPSTCVPNF